MVLKTAATLVRPLALLPNVFKRVVGPGHSLSNYLVAEPAELNAELRWAGSRSSSIARGSNHGQHVTLASHDRPFEAVLTQQETTFLHRFRKLCNSDNSVYTLTQDPNERPTMSKKGVMSCIISESGVYFHNGATRFFSVRELLVIMGFPVYGQLRAMMQPGSSSPIDVTSFNVNRAAVLGHARRRTSMSHQAGNSMSVPAIGAIVAWCLAFVEDSATPTEILVPLDRCITPLAATLDTRRFLARMSRPQKRNHDDNSSDASQAPSCDYSWACIKPILISLSV